MADPLAFAIVILPSCAPRALVIAMAVLPMLVFTMFSLLIPNIHIMTGGFQ